MKVRDGGFGHKEMSCPCCGATGNGITEHDMTDDYQSYVCRKCHRFFLIYSHPAGDDIVTDDEED